MEQNDVLRTRELLRRRREAHREALRQEVERLTIVAKELGVQRVAEKALKAFIYAQGEELVIGHSVEALSRWAAEFDTDFEQLRGTVAPLDGYYVPTRYPNGLPDSIPARVYTQGAAEDALRMADQVLQTVQQKLQSG
jgi:HEPN domain-containing protein